MNSQNQKHFTDRSCASMRPRHSGILPITDDAKENQEHGGAE